MKRLLLLAALLSLAPPQPAEAQQRCTVPVVVGAFPTDRCPWEDPAFREAMAVVEAARWLCPALDSYAEEQFVRLGVAAGVEVDAAERDKVVALGCAHQRVRAAFTSVQSLTDAILFTHLSAALDLHDGGDGKVVTEDRRRFLPELRAERARLAAIDHPFPDLPGRAAALAGWARAEIPVHTTLWSQVIAWTHPFFRSATGRPYARPDRGGLWIGYRPEGTPSEIAVSSAPLRLSSEGYPPGARYGWHTDAIFVFAHVSRAGAPDNAPLYLDIGWQPVGHRLLQPTLAIVRLSGREWRAEGPRPVSVPAEYRSHADFHADTLSRFLFGPEIVSALREAGDGAALDIEIIFRDAAGGLVSSNAVLETANGHCHEHCAPRLPLGGLGMTLHWASAERRAQ